MLEVRGSRRVVEEGEVRVGWGQGEVRVWRRLGEAAVW